MGGTAVPESRKAIVGERLRREEREDFYVLQHMSSFMGEIWFTSVRRELPALASPDGTGADGKWARDRRRKYWESTNAPMPFTMLSSQTAQKPAAWREVSYEPSAKLGCLYRRYASINRCISLENRLFRR